jgi:hypothetical protein
MAEDVLEIDGVPLIKGVSREVSGGVSCGVSCSGGDWLEI